MTFTLTGGAGLTVAELLSFRLVFTEGEPCDSFSFSFPYTDGCGAALAAAHTMYAADGDRRVMTGRIDDYSVSDTGESSVCTVSGRGMAALLYDNEAMPGIYYGAGFSDIFKSHAAPYGISLAGAAPSGSLSCYEVTNGMSEWTAVSEFARRLSGRKPGFDAYGAMSFRGRGTASHVIPNGGVLSRLWEEKRHGLLSEVIIRPAGKGSASVYRDEAAIARGIRARRIDVLAGCNESEKAYAARRMMENARAGSAVLRIRLAGSPAVRPGDAVSHAGRTGYVTELVWQCGSGGETHEITVE